MTASSLPTHRRGRLRHTVRTAALALSLLLGGTAGAIVPTAAFADEHEPTPVPSEDSAAQPRPEIVLVPDHQGHYTTGTPFAATIAIINPTDTVLDASVLTVKMSRTPLTGRDAVQSWLDRGEGAGVLTNLGSVSSVPVPDNDENQAHVVLPASTLEGLAPGVYPLHASLPVSSSDDNREVPFIATARSVVIIGTQGRAPVTTVVPLTATPERELLSSEELQQLTGPDGALTAQLDAVRETSAVLAIDPAIVAAIRSLGERSPASAQAWLADLDDLPNDRFALQFLDADLSAQAAAGLSHPLAPDSLDVFIAPSQEEDEGDESPSPSTASASETDSPDEPSVAELSAIPHALGTVFWPRSTLSPTTADTIGTYSDDPSAVTILPSSATAPSSDAHPHATTGSTRILVADTDISTALSQAAAEPHVTRRGAHLVQATALQSLTPASTPIVAALDRNETRTADALRAAAVAFTDEPAPTIDDLLSTPPRTTAITSTDSEARAAAVTDLLDDERTLTSFASILDEPQQLITRERLRILRLLGVGVSLGDLEFETAIAAHRDRSQETLTAVGIQPLKPFLLSANVDLPVWIRNDLPYPITVTLTAEPQDPRIEVQRSTVIHAPAATIARDKIPVSARIASGEVDVVMSLTTSTGVPVGNSETAQLTVRADWENIGLGALAVLVLLLLGGGIWRTVRQRRRNAQQTAPDAPVESADADDDEASETTPPPTEPSGDT